MFGRILKRCFLKNLLYRLGLSNVKVIVGYDSEGRKVKEYAMDDNDTFLRIVTYYPNGNTKNIIRYENDVVVLTLGYYENGNLKEAEIREPGMPKEVHLEWNEDGRQTWFNGSYSAEKFYKKLVKA